MAPILSIEIYLSILLILGAWLLPLTALFLLQRVEKRTSIPLIDVFLSNPLCRFTPWILASLATVLFFAPMLIPPFIALIIGIVLLSGGLFLSLAYLNTLASYATAEGAINQLVESTLINCAQGPVEEIASRMDLFACSGTYTLKRADIALTASCLAAGRRLLSESCKALREGGLNGQQLQALIAYWNDRLDTLYTQAETWGYSATADRILHESAKIAVQITAADPLLAVLPIERLKDAPLRYQGETRKERRQHVSALLVEVARMIAEQAAAHQKPFKEPVLAIIAALEEYNAELFQEDRNGPIQRLKSPFGIILESLRQESVLQNPDTPYVLRPLERVISDLANLELVLQKKAATERALSPAPAAELEPPSP